MGKLILILLLALAIAAGGYFVYSRSHIRKFSKKTAGTLPPASATLPSTHSAGIAIGVYQPAADPFSHGTAVDQYTKEVGRKPSFAWFSVKWQNANTGDYQQFDPRLLDQLRTRGIMPGLTWDASKGSALTKNQSNFSWKAIASGKHDVYITRVARAAANYGHPFLLRTLHEMNGPWYPWGYNAEGQVNTNPADFVTSWKHVVDIFRKEGATNVQFVWCLAAGILDSDLINQYGDILKNLYPGDDYVDWIALDGYSNLGATPDRSLQDVFLPSYQFLKTFTHRPMIFYEVGALENPEDPMAKANWITKGFLTAIPTVFSDVKAVNWFNGSSDKNPAKPDKPIVNWAVNTSRNSLNAWKQVVSSPLYQGSFPYEENLTSLTPTPTPNAGIALGVYESPIDNDYSNPSSYGAALDQYKQMVGKYPTYAWASVKWKNRKTGEYNQFDPTVKPVLDQYRNRGISPAVTWDPSKGEGLHNTDQPDFSWKAIASGKQDTYIAQFAKDAAVYHYPFLIRPMAEMDGNYYPWGYSVNGNTNTADFVAAWKHIVDIFRQQGATNVQFVWCQRANDSDTINKGNNRDLLKQLYPGDDFVDFIALDGYASSGNKWLSLHDEFAPMYQLQTSISTRPMILFEIGATENPNDPMAKANWITQGFLTAIPQQFPAVRAASWMDAPNDIINPGNKENDWRLNTSQNSLNAWKQVVVSPLYQGTLITE